jgi:hypothetical protein
MRPGGDHWPRSSEAPLMHLARAPPRLPMLPSRLQSHHIENPISCRGKHRTMKVCSEALLLGGLVVRLATTPYHADCDVMQNERGTSDQKDITERVRFIFRKMFECSGAAMTGQPLPDPAPISLPASALSLLYNIWCSCHLEGGATPTERL